jgi:hypothetical protein
MMAFAAMAPERLAFLSELYTRPARRRAVWGDIQAARVLRPPPEKDDRQGVFYACCSSPRASQPAISVSLAFPPTNHNSVMLPGPLILFS